MAVGSRPLEKAVGTFTVQHVESHVSQILIVFG